VPDLRGNLRIAGALARASLQVALQYRADFLLDGAMGLVRTLLSVVPTLLVFEHRDTLAGWTAPDVMLVMGLFFLMHSLLAGLVEPNLGEVVEAIRNGTLDLVLLKPADAQLLVSVRRVQPSALWDLVGALAVIGWAAANRPAPRPVDAVVAVLLVCLGLVAMYGLWLLAICTSFFFVRVDNLRFALWSIADAGRNPLPVYGLALRIVLSALIPVGLITSFPVSAVRGEWNGPLLAFAAAIALIFAVGSRRAWKWSLASYTSASS
jgi:ABC-2 type transport system permease protein